MKIYIARHWRTKENEAWLFQWHIDWTLTEDGVNQAKKLASRLKDIDFDYIYCSPTWRTRNTLKELLELKDYANIEYTKWLIERDAWDATWKKTSEVDFSTVKWFETNAELKIRAWEFLKTILEKHKEWNILFVSHWWFIKWLFSHIHDIPEGEMTWKYTSDNCSLSLLEIDDNWILKEIFFNDTTHYR